MCGDVTLRNRRFVPAIRDCLSYAFDRPQELLEAEQTKQWRFYCAE